jgi:hypothetical protein
MTGQHEESRDSERINCTSSIEQGLQYLVLQKKKVTVFIQLRVNAGADEGRELWASG